MQTFAFFVFVAILGSLNAQLNQQAALPTVQPNVAQPPVQMPAQQGRVGVAQGNQYIIQPGDTLKQIAERFCGAQNRWTEIRDLNNIPGDLIIAGNSLMLPPTCVARGGSAGDGQPIPQQNLGTAGQLPQQTGQVPQQAGVQGGRLGGAAAGQQALPVIPAVIPSVSQAGAGNAGGTAGAAGAGGSGAAGPGAG